MRVLVMCLLNALTGCINSISQTLILSSKFILIILLLRFGALYSQSTPDSVLNTIDPDKITTSIERQLNRLEKKIDFNSERILKCLQKQEIKIYEKEMGTRDSLVARSRIGEIQNRYRTFAERLKSPSSLIGSNMGQYIPRLDTLRSALKFLDQNNATADLTEALSKIQAFNDRLQQAQDIAAFIRERQKTLQQELGRLDLIKQLKQFNRQVYYYSAQIKEYPEIIGDPRKLKTKVVALLSETKAFQEFMRKNSILASLFSMPVDEGNLVVCANLADLQTRVDVNNLIVQQFASGGSNAQLLLEQNIQQAQSQLDQLKEQLLKLFPTARGLVEAGDIMPEGFRPNNQRRRSFLRRLEYGVNIQVQSATNFFPATTDLGLSVGYKLGQKSIIGVGASYKVGLGHGWNHMELSSQGVGFRSYIDWKLKGSVWISGGYEMNYKSQLGGIQIPFPFGTHEADAWQESGLIGLSKVIDVKSNFFKKTKLQLLWDFLSYQQIPRSHPVIFRIDYNLK